MEESTVQMVAVTSSQISNVGYDEEKKELHIKFKGRKEGEEGRRYFYKGVPKEVYDDLLNAESVGSYFYKNVKGVYEYARYPEPEKEGKEE